VLGVLLLLSIAAALILAIGIGAVAWEALHPPRRSTAWALAKGVPMDPAPLGRPWRIETRVLRNGARMPLWVIDGFDAHGPVVVIVHGWGRSRWDSLRRIAPFLEHASRILLPDLRGHGEAEGRTTLGTLEAADIADLAASAAPDGAAASAPPLVLVGHSMGAGIVIRAAGSLNPPPRGVILLAPYRRVVTPIAARLRLRGLPASLLASPAVALLRLMGMRESPLETAAAALRSPLLVITAEGDVIAPAEDGRATASPAASASFHALPGADHADPGAMAPESFDDLIDDFMRRAAAVSDSPPPSSAAAG